MAGKDPKDMTASELLREADSSPCSMCHLVMEGDESCATTGCASWAYRLADKIDAELVDARAEGISEGVEVSLRQGAELWAKANGWPDFREGEDFGAWLDRCTYKKPVDDCNEPVQFGEEIELHHRDGYVDKGRFQEVTVNKGPVWMLSFTGVDHEHLYRYDSEFDTIKRPAPEVLGADGLPIVVGETVYYTNGDDYEPHKVVKVSPHGLHLVSVSVGKGSCVAVDRACLTHTPPDTQERIDADAAKSEFDYWGCKGVPCIECPSMIDGEKPRDHFKCPGCATAVKFDLLRRQRELDARTGGDA